MRSISPQPNGDRRTGRHEQLGALMAELGCRNVLLVTDPGIMSAGLADTALTSFAGAGLAVSLFTEVEADPPEALILKAAHATENQVDGVVVFGGGSSMDVAKLVALLLGSGQSLEEIYGIYMCRASARPWRWCPPPPARDRR